MTALRFLFIVTLRKPRLVARLPFIRQPRKLPIVLSPEEVARLLDAAPSLKYKAALSVAYDAGLRASEIISLKIADIDSARMVIRVEQGKGRKSLPSRKRGTDTSCCHRISSTYCGPGGEPPDPRVGCFPGGIRCSR